MRKCKNCKEDRKFELQKRDESIIEIQDLIVLKNSTQKLNLEVWGCPRCDGDLIRNAFKDSNQ